MSDAPSEATVLDVKGLQTVFFTSSGLFKAVDDDLMVDGALAGLLAAASADEVRSGSSSFLQPLRSS